MNTFFDLLKYVEQNHPKHNFFCYLTPEHQNKISYTSFLEYVHNIACFLLSIGMKKGEKMVLMLESSPAWLYLDLATVKAGGVSVPMFSNISTENMLYQFENCNAEYICVQDYRTFEIVRKSGHKFKQILLLNDFAFEGSVRIKQENALLTLGEANTIGASKARSYDAVFEKIAAEAKPNDLLTIIYTSGTSGLPKGVELSHRNILSQFEGVDLLYKTIINPQTDSTFSFLPLAHIFQRTVTYYFLYHSVSMYFESDIRAIGTHLEQYKPDTMTVVPRFLEKIKNGIAEKLQSEKSKLKRFLGNLAFNYAAKHNPEEPHKPYIYKFFDLIMYKKIRNKLGGRLKAVICGGASLPEELCWFFTNMGVPLYQGYGLTETSPVVAVNGPFQNKVGTIGKPMKGTSVRLTPEGELLVKGECVMLGYHKATAEGARAIDADGWLATGDLASIDEDGYLKIIGRKKEQFKTSNGKFINPVKIESMLNTIPYIETSCVIAEGRPFATAILFPSEEGAKKQAEVEASLPGYFKQINEALDKHENVHYYYLHNKPASIEGGQITPSMKVIRTAITSQFASTIEGFYAKYRRM